jgi:sulfopyruvate decarboxylase alpha subunit
VPGWEHRLADALIEAGVSVVATVPDAAVWPVYESLASRLPAIRLTREEEGIGVLAGSFLGGGFGALLMQNTGFGNCINAIAGYAIPAGIPMLLVVNMRGDSGEFSPAAVPLGMATIPILSSLGVPTFPLEDDAAVQRVVPGSGRLASAAKRPVALLLRPSLTGGKTG